MENRKVQRAVKWVFLVVLLATSGIYFQTKRLPTLGFPHLETVTIAVTKLDPTALIWIAQAKHFFAKEGLNVSLLVQPMGYGQFDSLYSERAQFATIAHTPIVKNSFNRMDFKILATIHSSTKTVKIIARRDRGISSPQDLKGKRIAINTASSGQFFLTSFLLDHGLSYSLKGVKLVKMLPAELSDALVRSEVDAFSVREPFIYETKKRLGARAIVFTAPDLYTSTFNLVSLSSYIEKSPQIIIKILCAIREAEVYLQTQSENARAILSEAVGYERDYFAQYWNPSESTLSLDQSLLVAMEEEGRWMIENGFTTRRKVPNYLDILYLDALTEVKPEAVRIIR